MIVVFVYDHDARQKRTAISALEHGMGLTADAGYILQFYDNRQDLLEAIAENPRHDALAFIDLQQHERDDTSYSGHRLIDTIRRHPQLWHCRPFAFTAYAFPDVIDLVKRHGGYGIVSKHWLNRATSRDAAELRTELCDILDHPARPATDQAGFLVRGRLAPTAGTDDEDVAILEVFRDTPSWTSEPAFWACIRHLAIDHVGPRAAAHWLHAAFPEVTARAYEKRIEGLASALAPQFRVPVPSLHRAARRLLELVPQRRAAPDEIVSLKHLGRIEGMAGLLFADDDDADQDPTGMLAQSWVDDDAIAALRDILEVLPGLPGNAQQHRHAHALEQTLTSMHPESDGRALYPPLIRAVNGILDAYAALEQRADARDQ